MTKTGIILPQLLLCHNLCMYYCFIKLGSWLCAISVQNFTIQNVLVLMNQLLCCSHCQSLSVQYVFVQGKLRSPLYQEGAQFYNSHMYHTN